MNITIFGPSTRFLSGITYYTIRLSNALSKKCEITAVLFRKMLPQKLFPGWKRVGVQLSQLSFSDNIQSREILDWYNPFSWLAGYRIARKGDLIIFEWWTSSVAFIYFSIALLNLKRIPIIFEYHEVVDPLEHSNIILRFYSRYMGLLLRQLASHFVVHSEADKDLIIKTYNIHEKRIDVIPHGLYDQYPRVDKGKARIQLSISEENVILFFGLLRPYKGLRYLIKAFELLPESLIKKSRLLIAGEPWEDRESLQLIERSLIKDKITLIGRYVDDEEVSIIFSAADALVIPYTRASQSGVAHIGMAYGLPIIATRVGGLNESLRNYQGALLIAPEKPDEIKEGLIRFFNNKQQYPPPIELEWNMITKKWVELLQQQLPD